MNVKTFTAPTIQKALAEAREALGNDVVLLESHAAGPNRDARVSVVLDENNILGARDRNGTQQTKRKAAGGRNRQRPVDGNGRTAVMDQPKNGAPDANGRTRTRNRSYQTIQELLDEEKNDEVDNNAASKEPPQRRTARGQLFPSQVENDTSTDAPASKEAHIVEQQLSRLHERLDQIERRLSTSMIGTSHEWSAHPLFSELVEQGFRSASISQLFQELADEGYDPNRTDPETLRWQIAHQIRRMINIPAPKNGGSALLMVGPTGAGKTSLALKLAKHKSFYGRRNTAVLAITEPPSSESYSEGELEKYHNAGISAQAVKTPEEMERALDRVSHFDQIIIDSPPLPMHPQNARQMVRHIRRLIEPVVPLETHLVMNATRSFQGYYPADLQKLPINLDCTAITHLDETPGWGHVAEWIAELGLPVRFVTSGREMPDSLAAFSSSWFIEQIMRV